MNPRADALFRNDRHRAFLDVSASSGIDEALPTLGVAYADYDQDGDLDLVTGNGIAAIGCIKIREAPIAG